MRVVAVVVMAGALTARVVSAGAGAASPSPASVPAAFAGTWKGRLMDQPAVDLQLKSEGGTVSGLAVFYVMSPANTGGAGPRVEAPLRDTRIEDGVLKFGVRRQEDGGVTRMEMRVVKDGVAELKTIAASLDPERAPEGGEDPVLTLKKAK